MSNKALKVLILEDVRSDVELIMLQFESMDFDPVYKVTDKEQSYRKLLDTFDPDLILADFTMPTFNGMKALKILRESDSVTPFIFVTGTLGEENAVMAIKTGATDFIAKERVEHLPAAILRAFRERDERNIRLQEESKYRALIEHSSESTVIIDDDTSVKYVSPSITKVLGYKPEEILGSSIFTFFPSEEVKDRMKVLKKALNKREQTIHDECKIRSRSGKYIWVSATLSDHRKTQGIGGVVVNFHSIDERKAIEGEVRTSEMRFKSLTHEGTDLISVVTVDGEYTFVSGNHKRIVGYHTKDLVGKRPIDFVHPEDAFMVMQQLEKLKTRKRVKATPFRFRNASGKYHWLESVFTNLSDDDLVHGIVINSRDVTETVEKNQQLIISNERYALASKASGDHIYDWNLETGETFRVGDSLRSLFGYSNEEAGSENFWEKKVHPEDRERVYKKLNTHLDGKRISKCQAEYRFLKADGSYAYVNDIGYILRDEKGKAVRLVGAVTDVTARRNLELHKDLMSDVTKTMNMSGSLVDCLEKIARTIADFTNASVVEFWTSSMDKSHLHRIAAGTGDKKGKGFLKRSTKFETFKIGEGLPGITWQQRRSIDLLDLSDGRFRRIREAKEAGLTTGMSIPIPFHDRMIGAILLLGNDNQSIDEHQSILESIAKEMAPYIQRKKSDEELNRFFDLSPDVLCIAGMDGYYKKVNPALCKMLGLTMEEVLSKPIIDFIHPEDVEPTANEIASLTEGNATLHFENRYLTRTGQYIWLSWRATPALGEKLVYAVARNVTEQKELQDLLEKSQRLAKIGTWYFDPTTKKIDWTPIARDIYDVDATYEPSEDNIKNFFPEAYHELLRNRLNRSMEAGESWDEEIEVITQKGQRKWTRITGNAEFLDGKCFRVYGSIQDISDRKFMEEELKEMNMRYQLATKTTLLGVWDWDIITGQLTWDDGMMTLYGINPEEFTNAFDSWSGALHPEDRERAQKEIFEAKNRKINFDTRFRIIHPDGTLKHIRAHAQSIKDQKDEVVRMVGINYDITEEVEGRIAAEKASLEKNSILERINDGFFSVDRNWIVNYWNSAAESILGMPKEDIINRNLWDVYEDAVSLKFYQEYHQAMNNQEPRYFEEFYPGRKIWASVSAYPDENGLSVFFKDITDNKKHQQEILEKSIRSMEQERNRIARELHDGVLQEMVGSMMLAEVIGGMAKTDEKTTKLFDQLVYYLKKATDDTRRISHDLRSPDIEKASLTLLIRKLVDQLNLLYQMEFVFHNKVDENALFLTDFQKTNLYRVIQELITNAIKHAEASTAIISIWREKDLLWISVEDNGIGMDAEKIRSGGGIGIRNIRDRLDSIGADFEMNRRKSGGTKALINLKLNEKATIG